MYVYGEQVRKASIEKCSNQTEILKSELYSNHAVDKGIVYLFLMIIKRGEGIVFVHTKTGWALNAEF
jgi:hypothetical protein